MVEKALALGDLLRSDVDPNDDPAARRLGKEAVKHFFKSIAAGDMAALGEILTDDAVYEMPFSESGSTDAGRFRRFDGRDQVVGFWRQTSGSGIRSAAPQDVELSILADGSRIFIEQRGDMTMADGKAYRNRYVFRFDLRDGRVAQVREYINPIISAYAFGRPIADNLMVDQIR